MYYDKRQVLLGQLMPFVYWLFVEIILYMSKYSITLAFDTNLSSSFLVFIFKTHFLELQISAINSCVAFLSPLEKMRP